MPYDQIDLSKVKTDSLRKRKNKVSRKNFAKPYKKGHSFKQFISSLPDILRAKDIKELAERIIEAKAKGGAVIVMMGGHVPKCGLSPLIIQLMKKGIIDCIAMNGACAIHDFELALLGETSEDVEENIKKGTFGMWKETQELMNERVNESDNQIGLGELWGRVILKKKFPYKDESILAQALNLKIPVTVHVAIGTDILHMHPSFSAKLTGERTFRDFKIFAEQLSRLEGGCILNLGSAVIMPEVFLKALSVVRNLGYKVESYTAANFDMISHYRVRSNFLKRPLNKKGKSYNFIGHHEIMIPLLTALILQFSRNRNIGH